MKPVGLISPNDGSRASPNDLPDFSAAAAAAADHHARQLAAFDEIAGQSGYLIDNPAMIHLARQWFLSGANWERNTGNRLRKEAMRPYCNMGALPLTCLLRRGRGGGE